MATQTTNLNLVKPATSDFYDVAIQNDNMSKIDTEIGTIRTKLQSAVADLAALKAINTATMPDKTMILCETLGLYRFDAQSSTAGDDTVVVQPTTGPGRWHMLADSKRDMYAPNTRRALLCGETSCPGVSAVQRMAGGAFKRVVPSGLTTGKSVLANAGTVLAVEPVERDVYVAIYYTPSYYIYAACVKINRGEFTFVGAPVELVYTGGIPSDTWLIKEEGTAYYNCLVSEGSNIRHRGFTLSAGYVLTAIGTFSLIAGVYFSLARDASNEYILHYSTSGKRQTFQRIKFSAGNITTYTASNVFADADAGACAIAKMGSGDFFVAFSIPGNVYVGRMSRSGDTYTMSVPFTGYAPGTTYGSVYMGLYPLPYDAVNNKYPFAVCVHNERWCIFNCEATAGGAVTAGTWKYTEIGNTGNSQPPAVLPIGGSEYLVVSVASGGYGNAQSIVLQAPDTIRWSKPNSTEIRMHRYDVISYGAGKFAIVGGLLSETSASVVFVDVDYRSLVGVLVSSAAVPCGTAGTIDCNPIVVLDAAPAWAAEGVIVYVQPDGTLNTTPTSCKAGVMLSTTQLAFRPEKLYW